MKKLVSMLLALCLLLGGVALAESNEQNISSSAGTTPTGQTRLSLGIDQTYTVVIPNSLSFTKGDEIDLGIYGKATVYETTGTVKVTESRLNIGKQLVVKMTDAENKEQMGQRYKLYLKVKSGGTTYGSLTYSVTVGEPGNSYGVLPDGGIQVLTCRFDATTLPSQTLKFRATSGATAFPVAGAYTDLITFTVSVVDIPE